MEVPDDYPLLLLGHLGAALRGVRRAGAPDRAARMERRRALSKRFGALFLGLLPRLAPTLVCEIGAHDGRFAAAAKRALPDARVLAFEANPDVAAQHAPSHAESGVEYRNLAVAAAPGSVTLHVPRDRQRAERLRTASLLAETGGDAADARNVEAVSLDAFLGADADRPNVLWIDVEGAAGLVLAGAPRTLAACVGVHVELETTAAWEGQALDTDIARVLAGHGLLPMLRDMPGRNHYNAIFLRAEAIREAGIVASCREWLEAADAPAPEGRKRAERRKEKTG